MIVTNPFTNLRSWSRAQVENVSSGWWILLVSGILSAVAGGIIAFNRWTVADLVLFIGWVLVVRGIFTTFSVPVDGSQRVWSIVLGLVEVGVGVAVWVWPDPTLLVVAAYIGWLLLFRGTLSITGSIAGRKFVPYWGLILAVGILEVAAAVYLLGHPGLTLVAAVLAIGLAAMFYGVLEIVMAFEVKHLPERFDELVGGVTEEHDAGRMLDRVA
jgi:uncharacterized membrane protein HdeD (DUF308 family)